MIGKARQTFDWFDRLMPVVALSLKMQPGDMWQATAWASKTIAKNWSLSARLAYEDEKAWQGANPMSGGARERLRAFVGTNVYATGTHRLGIEVGLPLWEDRGTNNLETGTSLMVGWQKAF